MSDEMRHSQDGMNDVETGEAAGVSRRALLKGAAVAAGGLAAARVLGQTPAMPGMTPTTPAKAPFGEYTAKPLPAKVFNTAANGISRHTHEEHYKLYQGYVKKFNEINGRLAAVDLDPAKANQTFSEIRELKVELTFAIGGIKNHELYFDILGGDGNPRGPAADALAAKYGSVANWMADARATAIAARGWVWTALDYDLGTVFNFIGDTQNTFPVWNAVPVIGIDVYEHAYVMDFATARPKYLDAFFKSLDWDAIGRRHLQAQSALTALRGAVTHL